MAMFNKKKQANPIVQIGAMKSHYPQFKSKQKDDKIIFTGDLFIKPELPIYNITIEYRGDEMPYVRINSPALVETPPHYYIKERVICLYHKDNFKWNAGKLIAKEIMQWTIAWIYFYEYWLQSGEWVGPEVAHNTDKNHD